MPNKKYRLKINYCNYKKGNIIEWGDFQKGFSAHHYAQFRKCPLWTFTQEHIDKHPEIFEEIQNELKSLKSAS